MIRFKIIKTIALGMALLLCVFTVASCAGPADTAKSSPAASTNPSVLPASSASASIAPSSAASADVSRGPEALKITDTPETIYGITPVDLVETDISRRYFPALVRMYKSTLTDPDIKSYEPVKYPYKLFAVQAFGSGVLLLTGFAKDQEYPVLSYMEGDKVVAQAAGADCFSLNYTVFKDHTISFGLTLYDIARGRRSVKTEGVFADGQKAKYTAKAVGNYPRGYILTVNGQTWLSSVKFFDQNNKFVTDEKNDDLGYGWGAPGTNWRKKPVLIWDKQEYIQMLQKPIYDYDTYKLACRYGKGENDICQMHCFVDDGSAGIQYLWRGNTNLISGYTEKPNVKFTIDRLPKNASIFWADIKKDDGQYKNIDGLLVKGGLTTPKKRGTYCLIVKIDNLYYTLFVHVV